MGEVIPIRDTREALEDAIRDHMADLGMVTDWVLVVATQDISDIGTGRRSYTVEVAPGQPAHSSFGLLHHAIDYGEVVEDDD